MIDGIKNLLGFWGMMIAVLVAVGVMLLPIWLLVWAVNAAERRKKPKPRNPILWDEDGRPNC